MVISMKPVTVVCEDRTGLLADVSYVLSKSGIAIDGLDVHVVGGKAILSLMVKDPRKTKAVLEKNGFSTMGLDALVIKLSKRFRTISDIKQLLEKKKVKMEDISEISSDVNDGVFAITVNKPRKATRLLEDFMIYGATA